MSAATTKGLNVFGKKPKKSGINKWKITRHVIRSGLAINRTRRASDSIVPLLIKTRRAKYQTRMDSIRDTCDHNLFVNRIDYVNHKMVNDTEQLLSVKPINRSASIADAGLRRQNMDESILQYETIMKHLKNYDQFVSDHPLVPSTTLPSLMEQCQPLEKEVINKLDEQKESIVEVKDVLNSKQPAEPVIKSKQHTFSDFLMEDFNMSSEPQTILQEPQTSNADHIAVSKVEEPDLSCNTHEEALASSEHIQDAEPIENVIVINDAANSVLNELDLAIDNSGQELSITPNTEVNVIIVNTPTTASQETTKIVKEKPLMQRLFDGKKAAYNSDGLKMQPSRLPEEMEAAYEIFKEKYLTESEKPLYVTNMIKICRRGYKQCVRMLCITNQRIYNIAKKSPYMKEAILFNQIVGITCTPYQDGFICIHTKESYYDRGDWLVVVDYPCEFLTQLFMAMERNNNADDFLKIKSEFTHCRRFVGESNSNDCSVKTRKAESFSIKKLSFDTILICTP